MPAAYGEAQVSLDTGCRTAVAGWNWHLGMQRKCEEVGPRFYTRSVSEREGLPVPGLPLRQPVMGSHRSDGEGPPGVGVPRPGRTQRVGSLEGPS